MFAEIAVNCYTKNNQQLFTYQIPKELESSIAIGQMALVPFGRRKIKGIVFGLPRETDQKKLKSIYKILNHKPALYSWQIELIKWMSDYYHASLISCIETALPFVFRSEPTLPTVRYLKLLAGYEEKLAVKKRLGKKQQQLVETLQQLKNKEEIPLHDLPDAKDFSYSTIKSLTQNDIIKITDRTELPQIAPIPKTKSDPLAPTPDQKKAISTILKSLTPDTKHLTPVTYLLHGVTGSGKTEVYLQLIPEILKQGKQALILVPEIALTPQAIDRFASRFSGQVAVWHSKLNQTERYATFLQVQSGRIPIVIGSRSALFLPYPQLGLIVLDEEHETSYKQDQQPRYHARSVARKLARLTGATVVLGSATPSVESYYHAQDKRYELLELPARVKSCQPRSNKQTSENGCMPAVELVDLRLEFARANRLTISRQLQDEIKLNLDNKEQTILFLNRRGRSTYVFCRECGYVLSCPKCELPLTYHVKSFSTSNSRGPKLPQSPLLVCHHCGLKQTPPQVCPKCQGSKIKYFGAGTQKVVEDVRMLFPEARILRMDTDTAGPKNAFEQMYRALHDHQVDILIGTQMVAKGWDLPQVSLIGVILADQSLSFPDFRAGERTFQLLTQVAGRAGRKHLPGRVVIQTYDPENLYIKAASKHDYATFYKHEIEQRQNYNYPPFCKLIKLTVSHEYEKQAIKEANSVVGKLRYELNKLKTKSQQLKADEIMGPVPAFIHKKRGKYYYQIILKGQNPNLMLEYVPENWIVDIDPIDLL